MEYFKALVTIQSYAKAQSYAKDAAAPSDQNNTRHVQRHNYATAATAATSEDDRGLKINHDDTFTLQGKHFPLKSLVPEEI